MRPKIFLTFDCEDFINDRSTFALHSILKLLQEYNIKGLFFVTGHMAEKISNFPKILDLLENHEIGYHSSAHSVRPIILEYTDVKDYALAQRISLKRETSHVNPLTGECEGKGGITFLRTLFPQKKVISFRAPGLCWSPPHLEALKELGIRFDFSTDLSPTPIFYRGITFYPRICATTFDIMNLFGHKFIFKCLVESRLAVLSFHPNHFVNMNFWDSAYFSGNPKGLCHAKARSWRDTKAILQKFELFLKRFSFLQKSGMLTFTLSLEKSGNEPTFTIECAMKSYQSSISWAEGLFGCNPKFIREHFKKFFNV